ncbi:hypothetical protein RUM44_010686 [Polyplax serrata]|uniref:Lysophospholipid acyltransferase 7 n=1 Tax=Polyplax serrata TaxID=468196 RepID=A0ABR1AMW9_POLSC
MVQMILTLKIVGLAFEVHDSHVESKLKNTEPQYKNQKDLAMNFTEIFHYAYSYIGVLTGPYYSYKTFNDYYKNDFYKYLDCDSLTKRRLTLVPMYAILFLIVNHYFPVKYAESEEFYTETTFWYRLWYITPVFISFRMRIYVGLILSEAACIIAGLGAYPEISHPKPGKGPSVNFELVQKMRLDSSLKAKSSFNFETVNNINTWYTETDPFMRSSIKYWNMCVQYWMAYVVYKRFPIKPLRTAATFAVSALWHGVYAGYYLCLCSAPFYLVIEDMWKHMLDTSSNGLVKKTKFYMSCIG